MDAMLQQIPPVSEQKVPSKEQGYSARETELIRELVKARMEHQTELEHED